MHRTERVDEGRILFLGRDIARLGDCSVPALRRNIGFVFQDFKLVPGWSVFDNVAIALEVLGLPSRLIRTRVGEALERVGLAGRGSDRAGVLSGGEQQRVAVARAIVGEPALILADEPTGNLDPQLAIDVLGLFEDIHETGTTVLFATHDRTLLDVRPRRVVVLDDGKATDVPNGLGARSMPTKTTAASAPRLTRRERCRRSPRQRLDRTWRRAGRSDARLHVSRSSRSPSPSSASPLRSSSSRTSPPSRDRWSRAGRATVYLREGATEAEIRRSRRARVTHGVKKVRLVSAVEARREVVTDEADKSSPRCPRRVPDLARGGFTTR